MITDPARHFAQVSGQRHLNLDALMGAAFGDQNNTLPTASPGPGQPTPNPPHADAAPESTAQPEDSGR